VQDRKRVMENRSWHVLILFLSAFMVSSCGLHHVSSKDKMCFNRHCIDVEIVWRKKDMLRGLQFRDSLAENSGMLFVFRRSARHSFWMKDTYIPLDIIWLDKAGRVVSIARNVPPCKKQTCPSYEPSADALYVLEVKAGTVSRLGIRVQDEAVLKLNNSR